MPRSNRLSLKLLYPVPILSAATTAMPETPMAAPSPSHASGGGAGEPGGDGRGTAIQKDVQDVKARKT